MTYVGRMGRGTNPAAAMASADIRDLLRPPTNRAAGVAPAWVDGVSAPPLTPPSAGPSLPVASPEDILRLAESGSFSPSNPIAFRGAAGVAILAASADHQAPPSMKRFRGFVGVRQAAGGGYEFVGVTTFGPANTPTRQGSVEAAGDHLKAVLSKVNAKLDKKRAGKSSSSSGYDAISGTGPLRISVEDVLDGARQQLAGS